MKSSTVIGSVFAIMFTVVTLGGVVPRLLSARSDVALAAALGIIGLFVIIAAGVIVALVNRALKEIP